MSNNFGITQKSYELIILTLQQFREINKAVIFGSRAMGNYKKGSDIDLAIFGKNTSYITALNLSAILNEKLPIPYYIDIISYNNIDNPDLKKHIDSEGKVFYIPKGIYFY